jgi:hypothetical protein
VQIARFRRENPKTPAELKLTLPKNRRYASMRLHAALALRATLALAWLVSGCYSTRPSQGGCQTAFSPPRRLDARDIAVPAGDRAELVASGLTFPTGVAFDA